MNNPKISVIIPCYNSEQFLPEVFDSLDNQTFRNFEVIFVDDASTDNTFQILKNWKSKSKKKVIHLKKNLGAGNGRNVGLKHAKGDYVIFLDSDDKYYYNLLETCYNNARKTGVDILIFNFKCYNVKEQNYYIEFEEALWNPPYPVNKIFNVDDVIKNAFTFSRGVVWNKFFKRKFILKNHLFFLNTKIHNDSFFVYTSYVSAKTMYIINDVLLEYRLYNPNSITNKENKFEKICKQQNEAALAYFLFKHKKIDRFYDALKEYRNTF